jgi:hypothetical protein
MGATIAAPAIATRPPIRLRGLDEDRATIRQCVDVFLKSLEAMPYFKPCENENQSNPNTCYSKTYGGLLKAREDALSKAGITLENAKHFREAPIKVVVEEVKRAGRLEIANAAEDSVDRIICEALMIREKELFRAVERNGKMIEIMTDTAMDALLMAYLRILKDREFAGKRGIERQANEIMTARSKGYGVAAYVNGRVYAFAIKPAASISHLRS